MAGSKATSSGLRQAAGTLLVVGLGGTELTGLERAWLRLVRPGGIILFKRNITDAPQTRVLLDEATGLAAPHAARHVDIEGGTVNRLRDALAPIPSAQAVGAAMRNQRKPALARKHGDLIGRATRAFGFNTALAPVLDLGLPESEKVLGSRCASSIPAEIVDYAHEFLAGLAAVGVTGCGKHFPGLGAGTFDSHFETPRIRRGKQLWAGDIAPYRALARTLPMVMTNHAAYPDQPAGDVPASASPFWITTVLRKRLGFAGLIVSDDLEMGGILKFLPADEAAVAAVRAGSDLLLICHSAELILRAYEALIHAGERSSAFRTLLLARARTTERQRARLYSGGVGRSPTPVQLARLAEQIHAFTATINAATAQSETVAPRAISPAEIV